jgi:hypothetical protein
VQDFVKIDGSIIVDYELDTVTIKSVYGENSKSYTIGDKVELISFERGGNQYTVEKESSLRQKEIGVYTSQIFSKKEILRFFDIKEDQLVSGKSP